MSILLTALFLQMAAPMPAGTSTIQLPAIKQSRTCRDMMNSSSRLGSFRVCKTRSAWQRWEKCHSATRYCEPVKTAFMPDNQDLICKYLKETGSRIAQQKICATRLQWARAEQETQEAVLSRQNQSKIPRGGSD